MKALAWVALTAAFTGLIAADAFAQTIEGTARRAYATGKPLAVFERGQQAPSSASSSPLQNTMWQLVKFQGGDGKTLTPNDRTKVHARLRIWWASHRASRLQPWHWHLEGDGLESTRARPARAHSRQVRGRVYARSDRQTVDLHSVVPDQGRPSLSGAHGGRRHLRVRTACVEAVA